MCYNNNIIFRDIDKGKYSTTDTFSHLEIIIEKREVILLTDHRILYLMKNDLFGGWQVEWTHRWNELIAVLSNERGVELSLANKEQKKGFTGFFGSSKPMKKIVLIPNKAHREMVTKLMMELKAKSIS